eukprot:SM004080S15414  [mRNA]  locus=s4080:775:1291:+ [translate_table: standard]
MPLRICRRPHIRKVLGGHLKLASFEDSAITHDAATLCGGIQQACFIGACSSGDWNGTNSASPQGVLHSNSKSCACKAQGSPRNLLSFELPPVFFPSSAFAHPQP